MNRFWILPTALAPLLGATTNLLLALVMGLCAVALLACHQVLMALPRRHLKAPACIAASLILAVMLATCLQLGLRAWALPVALALGHYPALLCLYLFTADRLLPAQQRWRTLAAHLGTLLAVCLALGALRQGLTDGANAHLATLAPGGLILLGLLLALYNRLRPGPAPTRRQGNL
ncbi:Rnf-Nqr domain containing protein [Pseudomonas entomophila]|uniref:Rnf-Nqr domain containing protein n=1 Tax=Pseudomonas entomophila TaxID=312306 RepID=UPI0023D8BB71|nr:Rnf-Nqr domain containing protein [Pseudomonas entomophila]MDF0731195.1 Rnf-Nqr domain containing protein [Pseudomonas entomophila]